MAITYRPAEVDELRATTEILVAAVDDLAARTGQSASSTSGLDLDAAWARRRSFWEHLARTAHQTWVADEDGRLVGYARTIARGDVIELVEFFVLPDRQSAGIGRELLALTFPATREEASGRRRVIVATTDPRALGRYLRLGLVTAFPLHPFLIRPVAIALDSDLEVETPDGGPQTLDELAAIDEVVVGHRRDADHEYLMGSRRLIVYRRGGEAVAYGYHGSWMGPFAALDPDDLRPILADAEDWAAAAGLEEVFLNVPLVNRVAMTHLLDRGARIDTFATYVLADEPFGRFDRYVVPEPPIFL